MKKRLAKRSLRPIAMRFRQSLFWDVDPKTIDPQKHARYVIERILDLGDDEEVSWMRQYYPAYTIKNVVMQPRSPLHHKTMALWSLVYR